ncbi:MAG TPA: hypothetical protein PKA63_12590 [Oligoflexia bacterium]|nr:hypothetical protein [Oligoflexia bacterium]HMP49495.1 hypothetical protein [Oligoflexia bacterium]
MSYPSDDMIDLIKIFNKYDIEYLVVGGHAVNAYTEPRATKYIDLWINPTSLNAKKVFLALGEFGAPLSGMSEVDFTDEESFFIIGIKPNRIDILQKIPGLTFNQAWTNKKIFILSDVEANFLSLEDLIIAKVTAGRPQDLADVAKLRKV